MTNQGPGGNTSKYEIRKVSKVYQSRIRGP
jgi:hypothetical protein